jgi:hypothetical protein
MTILKRKSRDQIAEGNFALPGRRYPIHDIGHARAALARVAQHGTEEEQMKVKETVHERYPSLLKKIAEELRKQASKPTGKYIDFEELKGMVRRDDR